MNPIVVTVLAMVLVGLPASAGAQTPPGGNVPPAAKPAPATGRAAATREPGRPGSLDLTASALWFASSSIGTSEAHLTSNDSAGSAYTLFTTTGERRASAGVEARASYHVTRLLAVEGGVTYSRPQVRFTVADDAELAPGFTAVGETTSQFFFDASLVASLSSRGFGARRVQPFVEIGAGYMRELHGQSSAASGYLSLESGPVYHAGGGAKWYFRQRASGIVKAYGVRLDARIYVRDGGFSFDGRRTTSFAAGGGMVVAF